jgi:hypothetical protein
MVKAQEWLDNNYPTKSENKIEGMQKSLEGELILVDFLNLKKILLFNNQITKLIVRNCPQVKEINVFSNQITELEIDSLSQLEYLNCGNNKLKGLDISRNIWLKTLLYFGNPLEELGGVERLTKLEWVGGKNFAQQINGIYGKKIEELKDFINYLQVAINNKDHELEKRERKINELKELLGKSKEEIIDYKLKAKEGRLENIIQKLEIDRVQVRELQKVYQQLIRVRANDNQDEIDAMDDKIESIKDELIERGIDIIDTQKFCRKCESIAKLKAEQDKLYQERFEAKQEVALYNKK